MENPDGKMKIIFLDIDGVLNGYNIWTKRWCNFFSMFGLRNWFIEQWDFNGIHEHKIHILSRIVRKTGAKIVLSGSTRFGFFNSTATQSKRNRKLYHYHVKYDLNIIDITPNLHQKEKYSRAVEISAWLEEHEGQVESFVILDDENFDLIETFGDRVVITSKDGNICGAWEEDTGLKLKHIKQVVEILKRKVR